MHGRYVATATIINPAKENGNQRDCNDDGHTTKGIPAVHAPEHDDADSGAKLPNEPAGHGVQR